MRILISILSLTLTFAPGKSRAYEIYLGIEAGEKAVWVEDTRRGFDEIAKVEEGLAYYPSVAFRSGSSYFSTNSKWGYHFQLDTSVFHLNKQLPHNGEDPVNFGTRLKGYSLYAVPVVYYHFNRGDSKNWQYKAGIGVGLGYLRLQGNFQITDPGHPQSGQLISVNTDGFGMAVGVHIEAAFDRHYILAQNYGPTLEHSSFEYLQHNVIIAYRYGFTFGEPQ